MWSANKFRCFGNSFSALLLLIVGLGSCSGPSALEHAVRCVVTNSQVWNDVMPGSKPRCHAIMSIAMRNTGAKDIVLRPVEGVLRDARSGAAVRRFALIMDYREVRTEEARLAPGADLVLLLREPPGVPPVDIDRHKVVEFVATLRSSDGELITIESKPLDVFVTQ
jgi:hypothetical protein